MACGAAARAGAAPTALDFYRQAIASMHDVPQPAFVSYSLSSESDGFDVRLGSIDHDLWLFIQDGSKPNVWTIQHRTRDYASAIRDEDGVAWYSDRAFFDPTWYGSLRALRDGMLDYQNRTAPIADATPDAVATSEYKTIAIESVMGEGIYGVDDRGATACANGDPGHALHLWSRQRNARHQLSDVVVDLNSMHLCMMRFGAPSAVGFSGYVEEHFADVGGYWMQTGGVIEGTLRAFGVAYHHGTWRYTIVGMSFPSAISPDAFLRPPNQ